MPRKAQAPKIAPDSTTHGDRQEMEQMMAAAPMAEADPVATHTAAVASAQMMAPPPEGGVMNQPAMPGQPVTAGLERGAGPGPEAVGQMTQRQARVQRQLQLAAQISGNPKLAEMANRANRPIGRKLPRGAPSA